MFLGYLFLVKVWLLHVCRVDFTWQCINYCKRRCSREGQKHIRYHTERGFENKSFCRLLWLLCDMNKRGHSLLIYFAERDWFGIESLRREKSCNIKHWITSKWNYCQRVRVQPWEHCYYLDGKDVLIFLCNTRREAQILKRRAEHTVNRDELIVFMFSRVLCTQGSWGVHALFNFRFLSADSFPLRCSKWPQERLNYSVSIHFKIFTKC